MAVRDWAIDSIIYNGCVLRWSEMPKNSLKTRSSINNWFEWTVFESVWMRY